MQLVHEVQIKEMTRDGNFQRLEHHGLHDGHKYIKRIVLMYTVKATISTNAPQSPSRLVSGQMISWDTSASAAGMSQGYYSEQLLGGRPDRLRDPQCISSNGFTALCRPYDVNARRASDHSHRQITFS